MSSKPVISIVTALYNKGPYVAETVSSVLKQSVQSWEMIVVDNGSTDNGPAEVRACSDARVRLTNSARRGPGAARNVGLKQAAGEWVLFLDADDLLGPLYLERKLACAEKNPKAQLVVGKWVEFITGEPGQGQLQEPAAFRQSLTELQRLAVGFAPWAPHAALTRRSWLLDHPWFEELDGKPSEDTPFWFRVLQGVTLAWSDDADAFYRIATPGGRNDSSDCDRWLAAVEQCVERNVKTLGEQGLEPTPGQCETVMRVYESVYRRSVGSGNSGAARRALDLANHWLKRCPMSPASVGLRKILGIPLVTRMMKPNPTARPGQAAPLAAAASSRPS